VGGVGEVVRDRREALLVPPGRSGPLAEAMAELLEDRVLAGSLARAGRRRVEQSFSFSERLARLESLYERAAAGQVLRRGRSGGR